MKYVMSDIHGCYDEYIRTEDNNPIGKYVFNF